MAGLSAVELPPRRCGRRRWTARRITITALLTLGGVTTVLCLLLLTSFWRIDRAVESRTGKATAEVLSVSWNRTVVRYSTPDGVVHIPDLGVYYPMGLNTGDLVRVEYDAAHPDTVRVADRGADLALLPIGMTIAGVWLVITPLTVYLRRRGRRPTADAADTPGSG